MAPRTPRLRPSVTKAIQALQLQPEDAALAQLAHVLADQMDTLAPDERGPLLHMYASKLIRVLEALQSTPHARATVAGRKDVAPPAPSRVAEPPERTALAELRAKRAARTAARKRQEPPAGA
jgi:hypothetical protein